MWHVVRATVYEQRSGKWHQTSFVVESSSLEAVMAELASRLILAYDLSKLPKEWPLLACLHVALEVTSVPSFGQAVMRDTGVEHILLKMKSSLAAFLSSSDSPPPDGMKGTSSGLSPN